ncbi:MAG TPA: methionyl-tRNA formyltransferase [Stellaceae bacterium]|nr:methionyl-tRNA formyltransferase [Stellaceae bacterium]
MTKLRLAFLGTPAFAATILDALLAAGHDIARVYCQPARPAGRRGLRVQPSPVQELAERKNLEIETPVRLYAAQAASMASLKLDAAVVAAYGLILPKAVLAAPQLGCINVHASLLPRWRGAAPIERAIQAGDAETGISIMQMEEGLDTGPVWLAERVPIGAKTNSGELHKVLAERGSALLLKVLEGISAGTLKPRPQAAQGVSYAKKLSRQESLFDWRKSAMELERTIRAFEPFPGCHFTYKDERIRVLAAEIAAPPKPSPPGTVLDGKLAVACGQGALRLLRLQRAGRAALDAEAFLRGFAIPPGTTLPCPATS